MRRLEPLQVDYISEQLINFEIDGLIATNTTLSRVGVEDLQDGDQAGGLSGRPVSHISTQILQQFSDQLESKVALIRGLVLIAGAKAVKKIEAGADMVQLYSGLIYRGPGLVCSLVFRLSVVIMMRWTLHAKWLLIKSADEINVDQSKKA